MWAALNEVRVADNEIWRLATLFAVVLLSLIVGRVVRHVLEKSAGSARWAKWSWVPVLLRALGKPAVLLAFAAGVWCVVTWRVLTLAPGVQSFVEGLSRILNAVAIGFMIYALVDVADDRLRRLASRTESKVDDVLAPLVGRSIRITVALLVVLNVATVVSGKSIMTILAGLGVGGLAVALAGQDTIKNFFGSVVILGDKPFEIGDRVVVEGHDGPVESVGFRSTKIRTLEGHLVTVPNAEIAARTVQNIGKRPYIRRLADITITYDTPPEKTARAVAILKEILHDHEGMRPEFPPRVFFSEFNDCSLNLLVLYWYHPPDYWKYMAFSERVNMEILRRFNEEGIEFAFPTQTVYLANDEKRQLALKLLREQA